MAAALHAQGIPPPDVPEELKPPPREHVVLRTHAAGLQIYVCGHDQRGAAQWRLKAPQAVLRDGNGVAIGEHTAGPSWKYKDGSSVTGKAVAQVAALDPAAVPWLKIEVTAHAGKGLLTRVTTVQRIRTRGGQPPQDVACTPANQGQQSGVPYSADYYFYAPAR
jgi:Protein of unknown function (DUF3455)